MFPRSSVYLLLLSAWVITLSCAPVSANGSLNRYNIIQNSVTVSGISAGGFMAVQVQFAFSSLIRGCGVFAGGPFYCAQGQLTSAVTQCMSAYTQPDVSSLIRAADGFSRDGSIDSLSNLAGISTFLYSGTKDSIVRQPVMRALESMLTHYGMNVTSDFSVSSEHCQPTDDYGASCSQLGSPYINNCQYDGAFKVFSTVYGKYLNPAVSPIAGNLLSFDQSGYVSLLDRASLAKTGYLYVPTSCQNGNPCKLHIAFHGCNMNYDSIQDAYLLHSDYVKWAESNDIIVLFPQTKKSTLFPSNPEGCFDWWGYTDSKYAVKSGVQMSFVRKLITALSGF